MTAYKIYRFIQNEKSQFIDKYDFIAYSDELLCYGIYKKIGINLVDYNDSDKLNRAYKDSVAVINETLTGEKSESAKAGKKFSYNSYFKKPQCRLDFNKKIDILENDSLIESLMKIR